MNVLSKIFALSMASVLTGCALTPYTFSKDEPRASLKKFDTGSLDLCTGGHLYSVTVPDGAKAAPIPAGRRITLGSSLTYAGYNVTYGCYPTISFLPKEGETYVVHSYVSENKCYVEVVREDNTTETGVAFEPSIGPRNCVATK